MKIYQYENHEEYEKIQTEGNVKKLKSCYVDRNSLVFVIDYLFEELGSRPKFVLCHGTRGGFEQKYFVERFDELGLGPEVIGTEISHTATQFPNTIQWDFHEVKEEWLGNTDIIYSNSFDHTYKPRKLLETWMSCLSEDGVLIIEYSPVFDQNSTKLDPLGATMEEYTEFISEKFDIISILDNTEVVEEKHKHLQDNRFFILIKNRLVPKN